MRAFQFLTEKSGKSNDSGITLKDKVIAQVKTTDDMNLLDRIYTVLNQTNLSGKIGGVLDRETDTKGYVEAITKIIIDTPGTYDEKDAFITGFPHGYVDVQKMISGDRVKFDDLLTGGNNKQAPMRFVREVFDAMKQVTFGTAKGPGEFALAVLSPHIRITGKGDLNIGDAVIEVKASAGKEVSSGGGRLGTPGLLDHRDVTANVQAFFPNTDLAKVAPKGLSLNGFTEILKTLGSSDRKACAEKVFRGIFGGDVDISRVVAAAAGSGDLQKEYVKANYAKYKTQSGFKGLMIMNFALGELKYFIDPAQMAEEIYSPAVYLISGKESDASRQILSQVTLAPFREPPLILPELETTKTGRTSKASEAAVYNYAEELGRRAGIKDDDVIAQMAMFIMDLLVKGNKGDAIERKLKSRFREYLVKPRAVKAKTTTAPIDNTKVNNKAATPPPPANDNAQPAVGQQNVAPVKRAPIKPITTK
jgi:hypothetical protein